MSGKTPYILGLLTFIPNLAVQALIARAALRRWPRYRWPIVALTAIPFVVWIAGFPIFRSFPHLPDPVTLVVTFWLYAAIPAYLCYWLVEWVGSTFWRESDANETAPNQRRRDLIRTAALATAAAPCAVLLYGTFIERTSFDVIEVGVPIPHLPPGLEGLRILQLSDVHRSAFLSHKLLTRVVDDARGVRADLIVHTGDFISSPGDPLDECLRELARLHGSGEAFGCLGNHEIYAEVENYAARQATRLGINILRSSARLIRWNGVELNIVGVDYQKFSNRARYLQRAESLVAPGALNILLSHNPDVFPVAAKMGFDLTLAGHTHGGQVRTEILSRDVDLARVYTPYVAGLYQSGGRACYVTRGIGTIGIPSRLGAPPEITLLRLSRA